MDDRELEDKLLPKLVKIHGEPLDPNILAAYVDGALSAEEHAEVEALIAADPDALMLVRALQEDRSRSSTRNWSLVALAASVLLAVGLWYANRDDEPATLDLDGRLQAVTAKLARDEAGLFRDFALVGPDEMNAEPAVTRGGPRWAGPIGVLLDPPKELRWRNPPGATRVEIQILSDGFRWKQQVEGERHDAPPLEPGRYVVSLRGLDTLAGQKIRRVFEIVDGLRRAELLRALASIREAAPDDLAELVVAHYALRQDLFAVARTAVGQAQARGGDVGAAADALAKHIEAVSAR